MDVNKFNEFITEAAACVIAKMYSSLDLPRARLHEIIEHFQAFLQNSTISTFMNHLIDRLKILGEYSDNISAYKTMLEILLNPFRNLRSEYQCIKYFKNSGIYISTENVVIGKEKVLDKKDDGSDLKIKEASMQFIPLRHVLTKFFELPKIFESVLSYIDKLEQDDILVTNIIQGNDWKRKKLLFPSRIVIPLLLYQDDFETNNPLGSHKGKGKVGAVYIVIPCLPPHMQSKTENIFLLMLYKSSDLKNISLHQFFIKAVEELKYLENVGINVSTLSGAKQIYFSLSGVIGNNLAVHTILGFMKSFSANYPCRFCLVDSNNLNAIVKLSSCKRRTVENYSEHLALNNPKVTGISGSSVICGLQSSSTIDLLTVDVMHDILEGCCQYDFGVIFNHFIIKEKYFTLDDINNRIDVFFYGLNENRNKPCLITATEIHNSYVKMSASESLCLLNNIGHIIRDFIPVNHEHWRVIIVLKEILDNVTSSTVHSGLIYFLETLIFQDLSLLTKLFPGYFKPKHHFIIHYPEIMRRNGPLWNLSTIRCESKNRDLKILSRVS
ncbi:uncharacterized protein [Prorops nasuta]|uniref:uncharacterized protein n=1 Tax=Prorops nasuta TaxID=863751 RepID=UPI0034CF7960